MLGARWVAPISERWTFIFRADANPATQGAATVCGRHRCAQLLVESTDDLLVDLLPIVDLSTGRVVSRTGFFS